MQGVANGGDLLKFKAAIGTRTTDSVTLNVFPDKLLICWDFDTGHNRLLGLQRSVPRRGDTRCRAAVLRERTSPFEAAYILPVYIYRLTSFLVAQHLFLGLYFPPLATFQSFRRHLAPTPTPTPAPARTVPSHPIHPGSLGLRAGLRRAATSLL